MKPHLGSRPLRSLKVWTKFIARETSRFNPRRRKKTFINKFRRSNLSSTLQTKPKSCSTTRSWKTHLIMTTATPKTVMVKLSSCCRNRLSCWHFNTILTEYCKIQPLCTSQRKTLSCQKLNLDAVMIEQVTEIKCRRLLLRNSEACLETRNKLMLTLVWLLGRTSTWWFRLLKVVFLVLTKTQASMSYIKRSVSTTCS